MREGRPTVRLDRLLANLGYGSRRDIETLARGGRLTLDGAPIPHVDVRIALEADLPHRLKIDGEPMDPLPGLVLLMNKPPGVTCSHKEAGPLVHGLLPARWRRRQPALSTVGRLDKETSGLLLLTDDGGLLHRIISPKARLPKRYRATLDRPLTGDASALFASGTMMLDGETKPLEPAGLEVVAATEAVVTIVEGRYHQVRRMLAAVGSHVIALHREAVGGLTLPSSLVPGHFKPLTGSEILAIFATPPHLLPESETEP